VTTLTHRLLDEVYAEQQDLTLLKKIIRWALSKSHSLALWKNPQDQSRHLIINTSNDPQSCIDPEIESLSPGFVFSPFDNDDNRNCMFIEKGIHLVADCDEKNQISYQINDSELSHGLVEELKPYLADSNGSGAKTDFYRQPCKFSDDAQDKDHFLKMVEDAIRDIEDGKFEKVVPSRLKEVNLKDEFDLIESFWDMTVSYPNSFISLVSSPTAGTWIGATPEILISVKDKRYFYTSALAATQKFTGQDNLKAVSWTQKEIEEQALVSRYIINCFKRIRLREFDEHGPKTIQAGNLLHLKTDYYVDMVLRDFPLLGTVMLKLLHPTSAVCGMPKNEAMDFLIKHEQFDRQFFCGFLGPVNIDNLTSLFVNLRCGQLQENSMVLYSGAGVTIDSDPIKEWDETEAKCETIEKFL